MLLRRSRVVTKEPTVRWEYWKPHSAPLLTTVVAAEFAPFTDVTPDDQDNLANFDWDAGLEWIKEHDAEIAGKIVEPLNSDGMRTILDAWASPDNADSNGQTTMLPKMQLPLTHPKGPEHVRYYSLLPTWGQFKVRTIAGKTRLRVYGRVYDDFKTDDEQQYTYCKLIRPGESLSCVEAVVRTDIFVALM